MAPYAHFNRTLLYERTTRHRYFTRHSLTTSGFPSTVQEEKSDANLAASIPYMGVGPLILQPLPSRAANTEGHEYMNGNNSSTRLAFLAILAIPLVGGLIVFLMLRRIKKQKPAKHPAPSPLNLRSETARAKVDIESPRMQQLPRDRIRAMNSINRDIDTPGSPRAEYQIFSPRPSSPLPDEPPRPLGNYFSSLPVPESSEPSSHLLGSPISTASNTSCPPSPCTPISPFSPMHDCHVEVIQNPGENDMEGTRFTWDFRCKGMTKKRVCGSIGSVFDTCQITLVQTSPDRKTSLAYETSDAMPSANGQVNAGGRLHEKNNETHLADADLSKNSPPPLSGCNDNKDLSALPRPCMEDHEGICPSEARDNCTVLESAPPGIKDDSKPITDCGYLDANSTLLQVDGKSGDASSPASLKYESQFSASLTILDLKLDGIPFSSQIISALSDSPDCDLARSLVDGENNEVQQKTPVKTCKKRLILSKPNHRKLSPAGPSLKAHALYVDTSIIPNLDLNFKNRTQNLQGRRRASSDTKIDVLRRSRSFGTFASDDLASGRLRVEAYPGEVAKDMKLDESKVWAEAVLLRSSLSMPVSFELTCLPPSPTIVAIERN